MGAATGQVSAVVYLDKAAVTCGLWSPPWSPHTEGCWSQAARDTRPGTGQGEEAVNKIVYSCYVQTSHCFIIFHIQHILSVDIMRCRDF